MYWHGDVFYGIDDAALCRCIVNVLISQPCTDTFLCIYISTLHQYISLYQYLNPALMHSSVSISRHNNSPPSRQRSASTHSSPAGHRETQPFVPVIQRSADDPSNSQKTTSLPTLNQIPTPSTHFPICSLLTCSPSRHRHSIPSALKSQPVRRPLSPFPPFPLPSPPQYCIIISYNIHPIL